jgi:hypothetical protein
LTRGEAVAVDNEQDEAAEEAGPLVLLILALARMLSLSVHKLMPGRPLLLTL